MSSSVSEARMLGCIRDIEETGTTAHIELRNGTFVTLTSDWEIDFEVGDVVFIQQGEPLEKAPETLWYEEPWVGVVKHLWEDKAVIDIGGRLRIFSVAEFPHLQVGNTVEGVDSAGIVALISDDPIRYLDLPTVGEETIEHFKVQSTDSLSFDDFGGFPNIVNRARELVEFPLRHHDALRKIGSRLVKGVLFTGQPGTGKTMLAKIIAHQAGATFYEISGPEVLSKWYGQSEELIRRLFEDAARQSRAIIFFDEMDSLAAQRSDVSHEASRRIVGQLLASMDGFTKDTNIVVIATTNRPQDIDIALRRPGRFDWEINFPLPSREDREAILLASGHHIEKAEPLPYELIAANTEGWSAADLTAIWTEAAYLAVAEEREQLFAGDVIGGFERVAAQKISSSSTMIDKDKREEA